MLIARPPADAICPHCTGDIHKGESRIARVEGQPWHLECVCEAFGVTRA